MTVHAHMHALILAHIGMMKEHPVPCHTHTCMHRYLHTCMHIHASMRNCARSSHGRTSTLTFTHTHVHTHIHAHTHTHTCTHAHIRTCARSSHDHTYKHTHAHMHTCTHTPPPFFVRKDTCLFFFLVFDLLLGVTPFLVSNDTDEFFFGVRSSDDCRLSYT
jgi:hypothetical protein